MSGKKKTIIIVALLLVVFIGSISYALWSVTLEQTDSNVVKTGCFTVDMVEQTDEINLPEEYPVTDAEGRKYSPFTFTIQNTCTIDSSYSVNLKVEDGTTLEHQYVKAVLDGDKAQVLTDYEKSTDEDKYQLTTGTLAGASSEGAGDGESVTYNLRLWLDADTPESQMSKDFYAKIVIENITTSGVVAKEVLATGDISEAGDGSVIYKYYNTGEVEVSGTGRMKAYESGGLAPQIALALISKEDFFSSLSADEQAVLSSEYMTLALPALTEAYYIMYQHGVSNKLLCSLEPTNYEEYKSCVAESNLVNEAFLTFMDKFKAEFNSIKSVKISEGITNISEAFLSFLSLEELVLPSTVLEVDGWAFWKADIKDLKLNNGLKTIGTSAFEEGRFTDLVIPNTVTSINSGIIDSSVVKSIQLPKNDQYNSFNSYVFEGAKNTSIIIPNTITDGFNSNGMGYAENLTLNFECSEEDKPAGVDSIIEYLNTYGGGVTVNYNYQIES